MGFMESFNFKNIFKINPDSDYDDFDDDDFEDELEEEEEEFATSKKPRFFRKKKEKYSEEEDELDEVPVKSYSTPDYSRKAKEVEPAPRSFGPRQVSTGGVAKLNPRNMNVNEISLIKPKNDEDAKAAIDALKDGKTVILNLDGLNNELAQHVFDYISGASYCMGCNLDTIASSIFVFSPIHVQLSGDFKGDAKGLETSTSSFRTTRYNEY